MSFDLNSLYPMLIVQHNMSPETMVKHMKVNGLSPEQMLDNPDVEQWNPEPGLTIAANGACFRTDKQGIIPMIVEEIYRNRVDVKKAMLKAESELQVTDKKSPHYRELEIEIDLASNKQMCLKILLNSLYGATANRFFRYYSIDLAEGITLSGQYVIQSVEKALNTYMSSALKDKRPVDRIIAADTDSVYVAAGDVVNMCKPKDKHDFCKEFAKTALEPIIIRTYADLAVKTNAYKNMMAMKLEKISSVAIFTAKKRYILNVLSSEGVVYSKPKMVMKGIEAIKSSTPKICRTEFKDIFNLLINGTEKDIQKRVLEFEQIFAEHPIEKIAVPRGVSNIKKYMQKTEPYYIKGTPQNSRAAIMYNKRVKDMGLQVKHYYLKNGDRLRFVFLKKGNPTKENVIGFIDKFPPEFELDKWIDRDALFDINFRKPLQLILDAIGWKNTATSSLEDFFV
jgi:DNA polymerase elongation subunit (family B)